MPALASARSFLFAPASDERKLRKALATAADVVVADLEDAVSLEQKDAARDMARGVLGDESSDVLVAIRVNGADTDNVLWKQPEGPGLEAIAEGFRHLGFGNDHEINAAEWIVYDALYAYSQEMVRQGRFDGAFKE